MVSHQKLGLLVFFSLASGLSCKSAGNAARTQLASEETLDNQGSTLLSNADGSLNSWTGIGRLRGALSCTAFWLKVSDRDDAPAYAVTNGHCVQDFTARAGSDSVYINEPVTENWNVTFRYFYDTIAQQKPVKVKTIMYSTMKRKDLAVLQLDATQGELKAAGIQPLTLAKSAPTSDQDIRVVGAPLLPMAEDQLYLREHQCNEQGRTDVIEWFWFWSKLHRNTCGDIVSGSSGSPVLDTNGQVYAVINTTTRDGNSRSCYMGNPCEISSEGAIRRDDTNYAVSLEGIEKCWNSSGIWDLSQEACPFDRRTFLGVQSKTLVPTNGKDRAGTLLNWELDITHPKPETLVFKKGFAGKVDCQSPSGYKAFQGNNDPNFKGRLPDREGIHLVCFAEAQDLKDKEVKDPSTLVLTIDKTPPEGEPYINIIFESVDGSVSIEPIFAVPEYSFFRLAYGPAAQTDCSKAEFFPYRRVPIRLSYSELPVRFCVQGDDHAGNAGRIIERIIAEPERTQK